MAELSAVLRRPPGSGSRLPRSRGGWSTFSRRRKLRLIRTGAILVTIVALLWRCGSGGDGTEVTTTIPATTTSTTAPGGPAPTPGAPRALTAELSATKLPHPLYASNAASVANTIILAGGLDAARSSRKVIWQFDPAAGTTVNIATLPGALRDAAVGVIGDRAFILGGARGEQHFDTVQSVSVIGELASDGKLPAPRSDGTAVTSEDGASIFVIGGYDGKNPATDVLTTTDGVSFSAVATLPQPVRNAATALVGRSIFVFGGDWNDQELTSVFRIDLDAVGAAPAGTVTKVADLPAPLTRTAVVNLGGTLFLLGGRSGGQPTAQILAFDPATAAISDAGTLPSATSDGVAGVVGSLGYLLGGQGQAPSDAIVVLTPS